MLSLSGIGTAEAVWLVAPADTASIAAGAYNLSATLDTTSTAASRRLERQRRQQRRRE